MDRSTLWVDPLGLSLYRITIGCGIDDEPSLTSPPPHSSIPSVRSLLSLLLAFAIFAVFGGVAFFLWNTSAQAKFERLDKKEAPQEP